MKEVEAILAAARAGTGPMALATVVTVEGSSYRQPGARMLVCADGTRIGSVSGGCLEADVAERAKQAALNSTSQFVVYDSRGANGDLVFEVGCRGSVGILIQPIATAIQSLEFAAMCRAMRRPGTLATVFDGDGSLGEDIGSHVAINSDGQVASTVVDADLELAIRDHVGDCGHSLTSSAEHRDLIGIASCKASPDPSLKRRRVTRLTSVRPVGSVNVFIEHITPPIALLMYGAGPDAAAMAALAAQLGWYATIADWRPANLEGSRFCSATLIHSRPEELLEHAFLDSRTASIVMTHHYHHDVALLKRLFTTDAGYIGVIGSRERAQRLMADLREDGVIITDRDLERLHAPAGLDVGSESPDEIALSISAEIMAAFADRSGAALRDRSRSIHDSHTSSSVATDPLRIITT